MFDCGCHDNDTSDALKMAFFVHSPSKPTTTQKNNGAFKNLFPTLLHFRQESLLKSHKLELPSCYKDKSLKELMAAYEKSSEILSDYKDSIKNVAKYNYKTIPGIAIAYPD